MAQQQWAAPPNPVQGSFGVRPMDQLLKGSYPLRVPGLPWGLPGQEPRAKG